MTSFSVAPAVFYLRSREMILKYRKNSDKNGIWYSGLQPEANTDRLPGIYYTTESYLFPMAEEEFGKITSMISHNFSPPVVFTAVWTENFPIFPKVFLGRSRQYRTMIYHEAKMKDLTEQISGSGRSLNDGYNWNLPLQQSNSWMRPRASVW